MLARLSQIRRPRGSSGAVLMRRSSIHNEQAAEVPGLSKGQSGIELGGKAYKAIGTGHTSALWAAQTREGNHPNNSL